MPKTLAFNRRGRERSARSSSASISNGEGRGGVPGRDRRTADKRGVQDMEEEHAVPVRFGHHPRSRMAFAHRAVAAGPGGATRTRPLHSEDDSRHAHL